MLQCLGEAYRLIASKARLVPSILDIAYRATIKIVVLFVGVLLVAITVKAMFSSRVVMEIAVPRKLADDGFSSAAVHRSLLQLELEISQSSNARDLDAGSPDDRNDVNGFKVPLERIAIDSAGATDLLSKVNVPSSGLSLHDVVLALRELLGIPERKIRGEISIRRPSDPKDAVVYSIVLYLDSPEGLSIKTAEDVDLEKAIRRSAQSIYENYDPVGLAAHFSRTSKRDESERIAKALITRKDPRLRSEGLVLLGSASISQRKPEDAIRYFQQAIRENPTFSPAYNGWGIALAAQGDFIGAIQKYGDAIRLNPKDATGFRNRGITLNRLSQYERAIGDFNRVIVLNPMDVDVLFSLGYTFENLNDIRSAIEAYNQVINLDPNHFWALNNRCYLRAILNQLSAALVDCDSALRLQPNNYAARDSRGFVNLKLNRLPQAITDYDVALKDKPDLPTSLFGRGIARRKMGDTVAGDSDIADAEKLKADIAKQMESLGVRL